MAGSEPWLAACRAYGISPAELPHECSFSLWLLGWCAVAALLASLLAWLLWTEQGAYAAAAKARWAHELAEDDLMRSIRLLGDEARRGLPVRREVAGLVQLVHLSDRRGEEELQRRRLPPGEEQHAA